MAVLKFLHSLPPPANATLDGHDLAVHSLGHRLCDSTSAVAHHIGKPISNRLPTSFIGVSLVWITRLYQLLRMRILEAAVA